MRYEWNSEVKRWIARFLIGSILFHIPISNIRTYRWPTMVMKTLTKVLNYAGRRVTRLRNFSSSVLFANDILLYIEGDERSMAFPELCRRKVDFIFWESRSSLLLTNLGNPPVLCEVRYTSASEIRRGNVVFPDRVKSYFNFSSRRKCHLSKSLVLFLIMLHEGGEKKMNWNSRILFREK